MPAFIDENQQFIDPDTSVPIVNGDIFFGEQGADPEALPITVFVDRGLTTAILQPIKTNASGRTTQKIFIPGRYSFRVRNSAGSEKLIDTDAGSIAAVGTTVLTNVTSANTITANADPVITELLNGDQFTFTAIAINTDKMTLNIDGLGAKAIKFNFDEEMAPGFIQQNQTVNLTYNSTTDTFAWDNEGRGISILTDVAGTANAITAKGGPSTTGNVNGQLYSFKVKTTNTATVTLNINSLGAIAIKNVGNILSPGRLVVGIIYIVSFDSVGNVFELANSNNLSAPGPIGNITPSSIKANSYQGNGGNAITQFDDNDFLNANSDTRAVTQQAVKKYIDDRIPILTISAATDSTNLIIPFDNTAPLNTEGKQYTALDTTYSPKKIGETVEITVLLNGEVRDNLLIASLYKDSDTVPIATASSGSGSSVGLGFVYLRATVNPTTLANIAFKVRFGTGSGSQDAFINRNSGFPTLFGGALKSTLRVQLISS